MVSNAGERFEHTDVNFHVMHWAIRQATGDWILCSTMTTCCTVTLLSAAGRCSMTAP